MRPVFADTAYFLAIVNPRDQHHAKAAAFSKLQGLPLVTTAWILTEVGDALCRPNNRRIFRADKDWSLTDCISFVVMEESGLTDALTTDRHFEQAGFTVLLK